MSVVLLYFYSRNHDAVWGMLLVSSLGFKKFWKRRCTRNLLYSVMIVVYKNVFGRSVWIQVVDSFMKINTSSLLNESSVFNKRSDCKSKIVQPFYWLYFRVDILFHGRVCKREPFVVTGLIKANDRFSLRLY